MLVVQPWPLCVWALDSVGENIAIIKEGGESMLNWIVLLGPFASVGSVWFSLRGGEITRSSVRRRGDGKIGCDHDDGGCC